MQPQPPTQFPSVFDYLDDLASKGVWPSTWYIGLSGGVDSVVLLHLCAKWRNQQADSDKALPTLVALHVNHGLSEHNDEWQQFCCKLCAELSVEFIAESVADLIQGESNIESQARDARYSMFEKHLTAADLLLLGHHQDDQLETFLLRAFRGSGPTGLGAIPQQRVLGKGKLHRPLLNISRDQLVSYAELNQLSWIEDESNQNTDFDRNYIRHELVPVIKSRWAQAGEAVSRSAQLCQDTQLLLNDLAELDLAKLTSVGLWHTTRIHCEDLQNLSPERQANALRVWLSQQNISMPSQLKLQQVLAEVVTAKSDSDAEVVWGRYCCRAFKGHLYCIDLTDLNQQASEIKRTPAIAWDGRDSIKLPCGGVLFARATSELDLQIQYRQAGESIKLEKRGTKKVKAILQELEVPPWQRDRIPFIYKDGELIAIADLCLSKTAEVILPELRYYFK